MNAIVELNRFAYEPLDVGSLSQDLTSLSKIRVSLPWLTGSFFQMQGLAEMIQRAIGNWAASDYPRRATDLSSPLGC